MKSRVRSDKRRGSALMSAVMFGGALIVICGSFLSLALNEVKMADRSFVLNSLLNLAEGGADDAIWATNNNNWSGWQDLEVEGTPSRYKSISNLDLGNGKTGTIHIIIFDPGADSPIIIVEGRASMPFGSDIVRQILLSAGGRTLTPGGLVSKDSIELSGQVCADSYDSRNGPYLEVVNQSANGSIGTISEEPDSFKLSGQVVILGNAVSGKYAPEISGPQNELHGIGGSGWDESRVITNFTMEFPEVEVPTFPSSTTSLPSQSQGTHQLGNPGGSPTKLNLDKFDLSGQIKIEIVGPVQIYVEDGISMSGQSQLIIKEGGSLEIYSPKDFSLSGQGIINEVQQPEKLTLFGTNTEEKGQSVNMSGQGAFHGVVYAPYAETSLSGQNDIYGSLISQVIKSSGQACFHYDEALGDSDEGPGKKLETWRELVYLEDRFDFSPFL